MHNISNVPFMIALFKHEFINNSLYTIKSPQNYINWDGQTYRCNIGHLTRPTGSLRKCDL